jgi:hypothetical protein
MNTMNQVRRPALSPATASRRGAPGWTSRRGTYNNTYPMASPYLSISVTRKSARTPSAPVQEMVPSPALGGVKNVSIGRPSMVSVNARLSSFTSIPAISTKTAVSPAKAVGTGAVSHAMARVLSSERTSKEWPTLGIGEW